MCRLSSRTTKTLPRSMPMEMSKWATAEALRTKALAGEGMSQITCDVAPPCALDGPAACCGGGREAAADTPHLRRCSAGNPTAEALLYKCATSNSGSVCGSRCVWQQNTCRKLIANRHCCKLQAGEAKACNNLVRHIEGQKLVLHIHC